MPLKPNVKRIVMLGVGHVNAMVVARWIRRPISGCSLTCINDRSVLTYSGMMPGVLSGQYEPTDAQIDLRALVEQAGADLVVGETSGINLRAGQIEVSNREPIAFDVLSINVGSIPSSSAGALRCPLVVPLKPADSFTSRFDEVLRNADKRSSAPRRIAIVGGGVAGVEIAFVLQQKWIVRERQNVQIALFSSQHQIAGSLGRQSGRMLRELLERRGIAVHAGRRVTAVIDHALMFDDRTRHPVDAVIWATGPVGPPLLGKLGLRTDPRGFLATSATLQSLSDPRVFAVGDCGTVLSSPFAKAGVHAVRQAPVLWHNLSAAASGGQMRSFKPQRDFLKILNTGDGKAFLQNRSLSIHARWCWWVKNWIDRRFMQKFPNQKSAHE